MSKPKLEYPFAPAGDAQLRCFVLDCMADADIAPSMLIDSMEQVVEWIRNGRGQIVSHSPFPVRTFSKTGAND